ncbi:MAG: hypothetical protein UH239_08585 [Acutalibacteraceae bacterium]|nr:hypothetical protein [Acutalibacteraceae bacterium]
MLKKNNDATSKPQLSKEQLKENQKKLKEYDRILKIIFVSWGLMMCVIILIVTLLVVANS